jgi:hypothetical protein
MRSILLTFLFFTAVAHAQYGIGLSPGSSCSGPFRPAVGAISANDEVINVQGQIRARENGIAVLKDQERGLDNDLTDAKSEMAEVLTSQGMAALREHYDRRNSYNSYRKACGGTGPVGPEATDPSLFGTPMQNRPVDSHVTQLPPPDAFCIVNPATGLRENIWERFVDDDGQVSDRICEYRIAGIARPTDDRRVKHCRQGLHEYYRLMDRRSKLHDDIAELDDEARDYERRLRRIRDDVTDGTYCPWCAAQRSGYALQGMGPALMQQQAIMQAMAQSMTLQNRPMFGPPQILPYGGAAYPARPYAAPLPGYYGMTGPGPGLMNYGAIPGGIGPGAFGCAGSGNPLNFGGPFSSPGVSPIFGGPSPFNNPFANPMMAPMFNQGAGPGWGFPQYANGMPGFNMYGQPNPLFAAQYPYGLPNQFGLMGSPYFPYVTPNAGVMPFGAPYGGYGLGFGNGFYGAGSPYGNLYGPGYGSIYGGWGAGAGNYFGQVNYLNTQMQWISSGGLYGGQPPPYRPYIFSPIYNTPGSVFGRPPAILPIQ